MSEHLMIIVTGAPAAGKTTLSRNLAKRLNIPVINKDEIKELLFDTLGIRDREWAVRLGVASFKLLFLFSDKLAQSGKPFIVEGNFDNESSSKYFREIKLKNNYQILQLFCHGEDRVLYNRYIERDNSGERHPGHFKMNCGFEEYEKKIGDKDFKLDIENSTTIDINTTKFENIDFEKIYNEVKKCINSSKEN